MGGKRVEEWRAKAAKWHAVAVRLAAALRTHHELKPDLAATRSALDEYEAEENQR